MCIYLYFIWDLNPKGKSIICEILSKWVSFLFSSKCSFALFPSSTKTRLRKVSMLQNIKWFAPTKNINKKGIKTRQESPIAGNKTYPMLSNSMQNFSIMLQKLSFECICWLQICQSNYRKDPVNGWRHYI